MVVVEEIFLSDSKSTKFGSFYHFRHHTAYKDAPDDYRNSADEVKSLHIIIEEAAQHFDEGTTFSKKKQQRGKEVLEGCYNVLKDLGTLIEKYNALASADRSLVFQRIKLGTGKTYIKYYLIK